MHRVLHGHGAVDAAFILTERLSRRGYHLSREYGVDPLETVIVGELMTRSEEGSLAESAEHFIYADCTTREAATMATQGLGTTGH